VSEVPVVMMKSAENFDEFYAIPVRINLAPNVYKTYDPVIAFSTVYGDEQWYASISEPKVVTFTSCTLT
ncbi:MAG: hypothetical protein AAFN93_18455, partial [Bacteroidota bacterium]